MPGPAEAGSRGAPQTPRRANSELTAEGQPRREREPVDLMHMMHRIINPRKRSLSVLQFNQPSAAFVPPRSAHNNVTPSPGADGGMGDRTHTVRGPRAVFRRQALPPTSNLPTPSTQQTRLVEECHEASAGERLNSATCPSSCTPNNHDHAHLACTRPCDNSRSGGGEGHTSPSNNHLAVGETEAAKILQPPAPSPPSVYPLNFPSSALQPPEATARGSSASGTCQSEFSRDGEKLDSSDMLQSPDFLPATASAAAMDKDYEMVEVVPALLDEMCPGAASAVQLELEPPGSNLSEPVPLSCSRVTVGSIIGRLPSSSAAVGPSSAAFNEVALAAATNNADHLDPGESQRRIVSEAPQVSSGRGQPGRAKVEDPMARIKRSVGDSHHDAELGQIASKRAVDTTTPLFIETVAQGSVERVVEAEAMQSRHPNCWGLPPAVAGELGVQEMHEWQAECLAQPGVSDGSNLVFTAPTSAGKSLVADILVLRSLIRTSKLAIICLPFVALCDETTARLTRLLKPLKRTVRQQYGTHGAHHLPGAEVGAVVCTFEKANTLICRIIAEKRLGDLGLVVVDELHMLGEDRGTNLELLLTKLLYACRGDAAQQAAITPRVQLVGMSATLPNPASLAHWLNARLYTTEFRPVPLSHYLKVGNTIEDSKGRVVRQLPVADKGDEDHLAFLTAETISAGHAVLIFCPTRQICAETADRIGERVAVCAGHGEESRVAALEALHALAALNTPGSRGLYAAVQKGVAWHHAGLTRDEKELVERAYLRGGVRVLCCTSTLAAGVNLPARRVLFNQPVRFAGNRSVLIDSTSYRQMAGRAGRKGLDEVGESILVCPARPNTKELAPERLRSLLTQSPRMLRSGLSDEHNDGVASARTSGVYAPSTKPEQSRRRLMLEAVASGRVRSPKQIAEFCKCTLLMALHQQQGSTKETINKAVYAPIKAALEWLGQNNLIESVENGTIFQPKMLGCACAVSGVSPETAIRLHHDLCKAREAMVLATPLHLLYLVTPSSESQLRPHEIKLFASDTLSLLPPLDQRVAELVGVPSWGKMSLTTFRPTAYQMDAITRFRTALILKDVVSEIPAPKVIERWYPNHQESTGSKLKQLEFLQENTSIMAYQVAGFCERMGWNDLSGLISLLQTRIALGVHSEILDLMNIPHVGKSCARLLYKHGLRTAEDVAMTTPVQIATILSLGQTTKSRHKVAIGPQEQRQATRILKEARKRYMERCQERQTAADVAVETLRLHSADVSVLPENTSSSSKSAPTFNLSSAVHTLPTPREAIPSPHFSPAVRSSDIFMVANASMSSLAQRFHDGANGTTPLASHSTSSVVEASRWRVAQHTQTASSAWALRMSRMANTSSEIPVPAPVGLSNRFNGIVTDSSHLREVHGQLCTCAAAFGFALHYEMALAKVPQDGQMPIYGLGSSRRATSEAGVASTMKLRGLAVCWAVPGHNEHVYNGAYIPFVDDAEWRQHLREIMAHPTVHKVTFGLKAQLKALNACRKPHDNTTTSALELRAPLADVRVAAWLLDPDQPYVKDDCKDDYRSMVKLLTCKKLLQEMEHASEWATAPACMLPKYPALTSEAASIKTAVWKTVQRATAALLLYQVQAPELRAKGLEHALREVEMPVLAVLADMEEVGVGVNLRVLKHQQAPIHAKLKEIQTVVGHLTGAPIDLTSGKAVDDLLVNKLKLFDPGLYPASSSLLKSAKADGYGIPGRRQFLTNKTVLSKLNTKQLPQAQQVIPDHIMLFRSLSKLKFCALDDYVPLHASITHHKTTSSATCRVSGCIYQTAVETGRLSMAYPCLQTVQKPVAYTMPALDSMGSQSQTEGEQAYVNVRKAFVAPAGYCVVSADFCQLELRLMAHFSGDNALICMLNDPEWDPFVKLASRWKESSTGIPHPLQHVDAEARSWAKALAYGLLYGKTAHSFKDDMGCDLETAQRTMDDFIDSLPDLKKWLRSVPEQCAARHPPHVLTLFGRRRYLKHILKKEKSPEFEAAKRKAVNTVCQGSAAEIAKLAMVAVHRRIQEARCAGLPEGNTTLTLQIHDELLFEVEERSLGAAVRMIRECMEGVMNGIQQLKVPLKVKVQAGRSWGELSTCSEVAHLQASK